MPRKDSCTVEHVPNVGKKSYTVVMIGNTIRFREDKTYKISLISGTTLHGLYEQFQTYHQTSDSSCWLSKRVWSEEEKLELQNKHPRTPMQFFNLTPDTITRIYDVSLSHKVAMLRHFLLSKDEEQNKWYYEYPEQIQTPIIEEMIQNSRDMHTRERKGKEEARRIKVALMRQMQHD